MNPVMKSKLSFAFIVLIVVTVLLQMGLFISHHVWNVQINWKVFQFCLKIIGERSIGHNIAEFILDLVILYTFLRMIWRVLKQGYYSWKWNRIFHSKTNEKLTKRLNHKYQGWNTRFIIVEDESFIALTMGILRPKIIISTGIFNMFSKKEAEAILLHERYHYSQRDPMKAFIFSILIDGMGYLPVIKASAQYYKIWKEMLEDRFVLTHMGSEYYLGNVLLRLVTWKKNRYSPSAGVYFADTAINYRILQVLEPEKAVRIPFLQLNTVIVSISLLIVLVGTVVGGCS